MRPVTSNYISQTKHGTYNAVDYSAYKDKAHTVYQPDYYAPEDGQITALGNSGDCGLRLELTGATGRHGFCHNESVYVKVGDQVKKGQHLAKMGYTGLTVPPGEGGRHLHWVIFKDGKYVYPPNLVNEPFNNGGNKMYPNEGDLTNFYNRTGWPGHQPSSNDVAYWTTGTGNPSWGKADQVWKDLTYEVTKYTLDHPVPQAQYKNYEGPQLFVEDK